MTPEDLMLLADEMRSQARDLDDYDTPDTLSLMDAIEESYRVGNLLEETAGLIEKLKRRKQNNYQD